GSGKRLELVAEVGSEEVVDDREHLGARAVVPRERENVVGRIAPLAKDLDLGMPEAVDRLKLVADEEHFLLAGPSGQRIDQLALQPVRVLELVDHDGAEPQLLTLADRLVVAEQIARTELQVFEVDSGLSVFRRLVRLQKVSEQLLQEV